MNALTLYFMNDILEKVPPLAQDCLHIRLVLLLNEVRHWTW